MNARIRPVGDLLREWRQRRHLSQLALAIEADISAKHVSFLESGRAAPSREMILRIAERLDVPLRDRNLLLLAAGYAPLFPQRSLEDPALENARRAIDLVLRGHEPYPALAVDRHWTLVTSNRAVAPLLAGIDPALQKPPVNVLRLSLHPAGLAPRIANLAEWRAHLLARLAQQIHVTADPELVRLLEELRGYPAPDGAKAAPASADHADVVVPLKLRTASGVLSLISTTTIFGTPVDVTLSELAIESFFPADTATAEALRRMAAQSTSAQPAAAMSPS
ncbi:MAG: helix-turn-helix transcriptional regulator [Minicystis sp.]